MIYILSKLALKTCHNKLPFRLSYIVLDLLWVFLSLTTFYLVSDIEKIITTVLLSLLFFIVSITDFKYMLIPNVVVYCFTFIGLINTIFDSSLSMLNSLLGAVASFLLFWGIGWLGKVAFQKDALGGGDVKLAAVLGLFIGWQGIFVMLFFGSFCALIAYGFTYILRNKSHPYIPFGPFLIVGSIVAIIPHNIITSNLQKIYSG